MSNDANKVPFIMGQKKIREILPHRYPFLLVDRILEIDFEKPSILGMKNVTANEHFFEGHFPDHPIMPGVLILEALAQTAGVLVHYKGKGEKIALFLTINNAKFRNPVHPGDTLHLYAEGKVWGNRGGKALTKATVGSKIAVEAEIGFAFVGKKDFFTQVEY